MTTTLAAMQSGSARLVFVIAIDGIDRLLSTASESLTQAAWASTDWATKTVIGGLQLELDNEQRLNPWDPFEGGGILRFSTPDESFGALVACTDDGAETLLADTVDCKDSLFVGFADGFAFSGEAHVGTECFDYGFVSGRRLQPTLGTTVGSNRGKYVAHGVFGSASTFGSVRFAQHHRVAVQDNGVRFAPVVSEQPRSWAGRRVSLWAHVYESTGALNSKADALCLFAGELTEAQDTETGATSVLAESLLNKIPKTTLVRDQWSATVDYGIQLQAGQRFKFKDSDNFADATHQRTANDLVVVASDPSGTNEIAAGQWSPEELTSALNAWLGGETAAARIYGNYTFRSPEDVDGTPRTVVHFFVPGTTSTKSWFQLKWPHAGWARSLGYGNSSDYTIIDTCGAAHAVTSPKAVQPFDFVWSDNGSTFQLALEHQTGIFVGQNDTLPSAAKSLLGAFLDIHDYGIFMLECETPLVLIGRVEGNKLREARPLTAGFTGDTQGYAALQSAKTTVGAPPPRLRQVFVHEAKLKSLLKYLFYSTGTHGYCHPVYDCLPFGQGLGIAYDMLGEEFENSCDLLPGADDTITLVLEKPRTLSDAIRADLVLRNAHLVFQDGHFRFVSWSTPADAIITTVLDDSNKAEPIDTRISHRTVSLLDSSWVRNVCKLQYNRDITKSLGGGEDIFASVPLTIEDATSIDDMGGASVVTLDLRNVFNDTDQAGQGVRGLMTGFATWMRLWARPLWKARRSIAPTLYVGFGVGDCVGMTDGHVRDPVTGTRGITTRPALVVGHRYKIIVSPAPEKLKFQGEVDVVFLHNDRIFAYGPAAEVDETKNDGGFTAGYDGNSTLQFKQHEHSESSEATDLSGFIDSDAVLIIEVDPDDPENPQYWENTIGFVDTANNQVSLEFQLTGFDSSKRYRMVYQTYAKTTNASQTIKSFQAGSNKTIAQLSPPDQYGAQVSSVIATRYDHTRLPELPATISYGPNTGASRDAGYDKELALFLDNLMDHQTRKSSPTDIDTGSENTKSTDGWQILAVEMFHIGHLIYNEQAQRYLRLAPKWGGRGSTSTYCQLRIWVSGHAPGGTGYFNPDNGAPTYFIKQPAVSNTWAEWTNVDTRDKLDVAKSYPLSAFNGHEYVFIIVEGTRGARFNGMGQATEGPRVRRRDFVTLPNGNVFEP